MTKKLLFIIVSLLFALAACGGSSSALSSKEFRDRANSACAHAGKLVGRAVGELTSKGEGATTADQEAAVDVIVKATND